MHSPVCSEHECEPKQFPGGAQMCEQSEHGQYEEQHPHVDGLTVRTADGFQLVRHRVEEQEILRTHIRMQCANTTHSHSIHTSNYRNSTHTQNTRIHVHTRALYLHLTHTQNTRTHTRSISPFTHTPPRLFCFVCFLQSQRMGQFCEWRRSPPSHRRSNPREPPPHTGENHPNTHTHTITNTNRQ